jgi:hypothetical protein
MTPQDILRHIRLEESDNSRVRRGLKTRIGKKGGEVVQPKQQTRAEKDW